MGVKPGEMNGYEHINTAFPDWDTPYGRHVKSKDHYDRIMKENGFISYEESKDINKDGGLKPYILSEKAKKILHIVSRDKKNGKVRMTTELINRMKEIGAIKDTKIPEYIMIPELV